MEEVRRNMKDERIAMGIGRKTECRVAACDSEHHITGHMIAIR